MAANAKSHPGKGEGVVEAVAPVIGAAIANALRTAIAAAIDLFDGYISRSLRLAAVVSVPVKDVRARIRRLALRGHDRLLAGSGGLFH
jgi:hypothetical protein